MSYKYKRRSSKFVKRTNKKKAIYHHKNYVASRNAIIYRTPALSGTIFPPCYKTRLRLGGYGIIPSGTFGWNYALSANMLSFPLDVSSVLDFKQPTEPDTYSIPGFNELFTGNYYRNYVVMRSTIKLQIYAGSSDQPSCWSITPSTSATNPGSVLVAQAQKGTKILTVDGVIPTTSEGMKPSTEYNTMICTLDVPKFVGRSPYMMKDDYSGGWGGSIAVPNPTDIMWFVINGGTLDGVAAAANLYFKMTQWWDVEFYNLTNGSVS